MLVIFFDRSINTLVPQTCTVLCRTMNVYSYLYSLRLDSPLLCWLHLLVEYTHTWLAAWSFAGALDWVLVAWDWFAVWPAHRRGGLTVATGGSELVEPGRRECLHQKSSTSSTKTLRMGSLQNTIDRNKLNMLWICLQVDIIFKVYSLILTSSFYIINK